MARRRLTRPEQTERNRAELLAAARTVFLDRGYHGATLEQIADEAGFSKGVVYSQFRSKADLFLALLDARIRERAAANLARSAGLAGAAGVATMFEHSLRTSRADAGWGLLVIEFRVHAARDPELNRHYAESHQRTLDAVAEVCADIYARAGQRPPLPVRRLVELLFALTSGVELERAADPAALADDQLVAAAHQLAHDGVPTTGAVEAIRD